MNKQEQMNKQEEVNEVYEKPSIEVIEMEMEGSILAGSAPDYRPGRG